MDGMTTMLPSTATPDSRTGDHACKRTHGTVGDLLSLVPAPAPDKAMGDPFITMSNRAAKGWLALFAHAQRHGTWRPSPVDPSRRELAEGQQLTLTAHWTVAGLGHALGVNRDTAGKALAELVAGGWVRREDPRDRGQFGGIDYSLTVPETTTVADKKRVAKGLKQRGVEFATYRWRTAVRVLEDQEIKRVQEDVIIEIATEQADLAGDEQKATELASERIRRLTKGL